MRTDPELSDMFDAAKAVDKPIATLVAELPCPASALQVQPIIDRAVVEITSLAEMDDLITRLDKQMGGHKLTVLRKLFAEAEKAAKQRRVEEEDSVHPRLLPYVERYAFINIGGAALVLDMSDPKNQNALMTAGSFEFLNRDDRSRHPTKNEDIYWARAFINKPPLGTRIYRRGFIFDPRLDANNPGYFNLYPGMNTEPKPGSCRLLKELVYEVWAAGDQNLGDWIWEWLMHIVARPWERPDTSIAITGPQGVGKSLIVRCMRSILGDMVLHVAQTDQVLGTFNGSIQGKLLIALDEAAFSGNVQEFERLKHLITGDRVHINIKHKPSYDIDNYARTLLLTNNQHAIQAMRGERRYTMLRPDEEAAKRWQAENKYEALLEEWENGGAEAFLHEALNHEFRTLPDSKRLVIQRNYVTEHLAEQVAMSRRGFEKAVYQFLATGKLTYYDAAGNLCTIYWQRRAPLQVRVQDLLYGLVSSLSGKDKEHHCTLNQMHDAFKQFGIESKLLPRSRKYGTQRQFPSRDEALNSALAVGKISQTEFADADEDCSLHPIHPDVMVAKLEAPHSIH